MAVLHKHHLVHCWTLVHFLVLCGGPVQMKFSLDLILIRSLYGAVWLKWLTGVLRVEWFAFIYWVNRMNCYCCCFCFCHCCNFCYCNYCCCSHCCCNCYGCNHCSYNYCYDYYYYYYCCCSRHCRSINQSINIRLFNDQNDTAAF